MSGRRRRLDALILPAIPITRPRPTGLDLRPSLRAMRARRPCPLRFVTSSGRLGSGIDRRLLPALFVGALVACEGEARLGAGAVHRHPGAGVPWRRLGAALRRRARAPASGRAGRSWREVSAGAATGGGVERYSRPTSRRWPTTLNGKCSHSRTRATKRISSWSTSWRDYDLGSAGGCCSPATGIRARMPTSIPSRRAGLFRCPAPTTAPRVW